MAPAVGIIVVMKAISSGNLWSFLLRNKRAIEIVVLAAVYFVAGKFGLTMAFVHPSSTAVWPPTGIALAALLIFGYRVWPGIFLGAFLVNLTTAGSAITSLGIAAGNTLEPVLGAYLVSRFANGRKCFESVQDTVKFAILAGASQHHGERHDRRHLALAGRFRKMGGLQGNLVHLVAWRYCRCRNCGAAANPMERQRQSPLELEPAE